MTDKRAPHSGLGDNYWERLDNAAKIVPAVSDSRGSNVFRVSAVLIDEVDPELLEKTGGILRGMSGSPIIQNSMLVGAVTHVFVNNPEQGYAIFAQKMTETLESLESGEMKLAS